MALFVFWREAAAKGCAAERLHGLLQAEAHLISERTTTGRQSDAAGDWHFAAYATRTHFYAPEAQLWQEAGQGTCVIHGLIWRTVDGRPVLLDAHAVAELLDRPGAELPSDVTGEYAVARLYSDGTLDAFSDRAGLHQIFHGAGGETVLANRAGLVATVLDDWAPDPAGLRWLAAIGYRVGTATAYRAVAQLAQEHRIGLGPRGSTVTAMTDPVICFDGSRGFSAALDPLLDEGIAQAQAAIRLGISSDGPIDLPITGGKDSRVILALCLAAGLRDRLRLFTRGYEGHPDVVAGAGIAIALGLSHRREPPHGSDEAAHWSRERFFDKLMAQTWQTDGMVGGWDLILGERLGTETLITGHIGEVLKAYSKKPLPPGPLDPIAMVRLQAPFDPMALLRPGVRAEMEAQLSAQMDAARAAGAAEADLPDVFYYRNRLPNWLGAIRAIKSFERQPVVPLGAPALLRLAFRLTPEERRRELLHYEIIRRCAPELLVPAFAMQSWDPALGEGTPRTAPILPSEGAPPTFGNWQFSINHNPAIRAAIAAEAMARDDLTLWETVDRDALVDRLHHRRLDYFDGISMLGLVVAMFHERTMIRPVRLGATGPAAVPGRPAPAMPASVDPPVVTGYLDAVRREGEAVSFGGWAHAPAWPAAQVAIEARTDGRSLGITVAGNDRPDLVPHGIGDGRHGFSLAVPLERLDGAEAEIIVGAFDGDSAIARVTVAP
jgi:hypothetical protein